MPYASSPLRQKKSNSHWHGHENGNGVSSSSRDPVSESYSGSDSQEDSGSALAESTEEESSSDEDTIKIQQRKASKANITPHHRLEKRPQRRTAARASEAWSELGPKSHRKTIVEVVVDVPYRASGRPMRDTPKKRHLEDIISTPTKRIQKDVSTPKGKERAKESGRIEEGQVRTPVKKQKLVTPQKKQAPITPASTARKRAVEPKETRILITRGEEEEENLDDRNLIRPTSSDAYFASHAPRLKRNSSKHQTSDNVISGSLPAMSSRAIAQLSSNIVQRLSVEDRTSSNLLCAAHFEPYYDHWWSLLACTNRPLHMYGVGSKRFHLQNFARYLAKEGRCASVVVRGESGGRIEDVLREIERYIDMSSISPEQRKLYSNPLEARAHALVKVMQNSKDFEKTPPAFLVLIHNFDTALFLQEKSLNVLAILSSSNRIHLCVDTCHVNSGLVSQLHSTLNQESLSWLYINLTTYVPMLEEIISERGIGIAKTIGLPRILDIRAAGGGGSDMVLYHDDDDHHHRSHRLQLSNNGVHSTILAADQATNNNLLSERAAIHILRSVTVKAKRLFLLLGTALLKKKEGAAAGSTITYGDLTTLARLDFLAMAPDSLRNLLVEFTSHGLIRIEGHSQQHQQQGAAESQDQIQGLVQFSDGANVTIALGKTDLVRVVEEFQAQI